MKMPWYFVFFKFRTNGKKIQVMRTTSVTVMVIFFALLFWKFLDHSNVQISFSTIKRHIDNGIWETPYSLRFYGHESTYALILFAFQTSWKQIFLNNYQLHQNPSLQFRKHWCTKIEDNILLVIKRFFFSETNRF